MTILDALYIVMQGPGGARVGGCGGSGRAAAAGPRAGPLRAERPGPRGDAPVPPSLATHAILTTLKAGECVRHCM